MVRQAHHDNLRQLETPAPYPMWLSHLMRIIRRSPQYDELHVS